MIGRSRDTQSIIILMAGQPISVQLSVLLSYNNKQAAFVKSLVTLFNVTHFYYKITNFISRQIADFSVCWQLGLLLGHGEPMAKHSRLLDLALLYITIIQYGE